MKMLYEDYDWECEYCAYFGTEYCKRAEKDETAISCDDFVEND